MPKNKPMRASKLTLAAALALGCLACFQPAARAQAAVSATLSASFSPNWLGARTTLFFGFAFSAPAGQVPPPLVQIELRYPNYVGFGVSDLGLATCEAHTLEASGPAGCPPNSVMGYGHTLTGIVLGTTMITEEAPITIVRAPTERGRLGLLFYSEGTAPVNTRIVFSGVLLPAPSPFGGLVSIGVPLVPTLPGAPFISVIHLHATIGPAGVVYYEHVGGSVLAYHPRGILLPNSCPYGGFPFAARFLFEDGSRASARVAAPCPAALRNRPRHRAARSRTAGARAP
jgi:hypothetical protein